MKIWLRERMHKPIDQTIKTLNRKLIGHYNYYGITDNSRCIQSFRFIAETELFKVLRRRTQKNKINWDKYREILKHFPITPARIRVSIYD